MMDLPTYSNMWNYKTKSWEPLLGLPPEDRVGEFLPQNPAALPMYQVLRSMGYGHPHAMISVLRAAVGEPPDNRNLPGDRPDLFSSQEANGG